MSENTALLSGSKGTPKDRFKRVTRSIHAVYWMSNPKEKARRQSRQVNPTDLQKVFSQSTQLSMTLGSQISRALGGNQLNLLLLAVPGAFLCQVMNFPPSWTFVFAFLGLIPLAALLGDLTEDLAMRSNDAIGALLNASFGNATELIVSIFALRNNMYDVIKSSLIGSILGNMMLVLGSSFLVVGLRNANINSGVGFNLRASQYYCSLLLLACMGMIIPSVMFVAYPNHEQVNTLAASRQISVIMILAYVLYIVFTLITHKDIFEGSGDEVQGTVDEGDAEEEGEDPQYSTQFATGLLALTTVMISFLSEFLVDTLEPAAKHWGLSTAFISVILLPIVGNAAEHATAIIMAYKGKMDIALGVAVGSSIQIALFAVPALVLASYAVGKELDLHFPLFISSLMVMSIIITNSFVYGGHCSWLSGSLLLMAYLMIAVALLHVP